jgi:hypothetical protein
MSRNIERLKFHFVFRKMQKTLYSFVTTLVCNSGHGHWAGMSLGQKVEIWPRKAAAKARFFTCPVRSAINPGLATPVSFCKQHMMVDMHSAPWVIPAGLQVMLLRSG